ncbi:MAG: cupredoxin domain-containing protein [Pyrinomonadaceae bacterium]
MRKIYTLATIFVLSIAGLFAAACNSGTANMNGDNSHTVASGDMLGDDESIHGKSDFRIAFQTEPAQVEAGKLANLVFTVRDKAGNIVKDLQIVHEKPMHLLIVSNDLAEFYHIHPEPASDGSFRVEHNFPNGGDYKLYADFTPQNSDQVVEKLDLNVAGTARPKTALVAETKLEKAVDGLKVTMKPSVAIKAGQELTLDFAAFDAATGKPVIDLENYLGELAHFVIISEDLVDFVHAHPMAKGESMDGMKMEGEKDHGADGHSHGEETKGDKKALGYEVSAHMTFPRPGIYKLWAQFQRAGRIIIVPFIVDVPAGDNGPVKAANVPAGATKITVSEKGYEPASVPVKKGQPVKLAFYRSDANNCGGEVVFAKLNIRKKLPVGETVMVEFTPKDSGEIAFACGMNMLSGKVVVTEN